MSTGTLAKYNYIHLVSAFLDFLSEKILCHALPNYPSVDTTMIQYIMYNNYTILTNRKPPTKKTRRN